MNNVLIDKLTAAKKLAKQADSRLNAALKKGDPGECGGAQVVVRITHDLESSFIRDLLLSETNGDDNLKALCRFSWERQR